jgi:ABC-type multidrug transport system ATPase subunit
MTNLAIATNALRKSYGDKTVLDDIDLACGSPEVAAWHY